MLDKLLLCSDEQSLIIATATPTLSDKSLDLGVLTSTDTLGNTMRQGDPGRGLDIELMCQVIQTVLATGGASELMVELVVADNAALDSNLVVLQQSAAIAKATLVAGYNFRIGGVLPPGLGKRYVGLRYNVTTNAITTGKITAGLAPKGRQTVFA